MRSSAREHFRTDILGTAIAPGSCRPLGELIFGSARAREGAIWEEKQGRRRGHFQIATGQGTQWKLTCLSSGRARPG